MEHRQTPTFAILLRRFRLAAGLSQEALAERAALSAEGISALERGARCTPHRHTVAQLADALELGPVDRTVLASAATFPARPRDRTPRPVGESDSNRRCDNLPLPLTSFHGRERDVEILGEALQRRRLVTLCGVGGVGKTRLALEAARAMRSHFRDGVLFVELAAVLDSEQVVPRIAALFKVPDRRGRALLETLTLALGDRHILLVLDNCEHVLDVVATAARQLLENCTQLHVLTTTREPLHLPGERVHWLAPLDILEPTAHLPSLGELRASPAIRLFFDRAADVARAFRVETEDERRAVLAICARLDGLPLAIELAAARTNLLGLVALEARLDDRFGVLTRGERTAPARQRTLRATLDWSYALLTEPERVVFRRLGIFVGGCTLEAAQAVCADGEAVMSPDVFELLGSLVEKSLIVADVMGKSPRYRLLETMRAYAREHLSASNELPKIAHLHLAHFCRFTEHADETFGAIPIQQWLPPLRIDLDNIRSALRWAFGEGNAPAEGLALVAAMGWSFGRLSFYAEGQRWCQRALEMPEIEHSPRLEAHLQLAMMVYHYFEGVDAGEETLERAFAAGMRAAGLYRSLDERKRLAYMLPWLGEICVLVGKRDQGAKLATEGIALARCLGDAFRISFGLCWTSLTLQRDDVESRRAMLLEALDVANAIDDAVAIAIASHLLGLLCAQIGESVAARAYLEKGIAHFERAGSYASVVSAYGMLAWCAVVEGDSQAGRVNARKAIVLRQRLQGGETTIPAFVSIAGVAMLEGQSRNAARLLGAARKLYERLQHWESIFGGKPVYESALELLCSTLPERELAALMLEGGSWSIERAFMEALSV